MRYFFGLGAPCLPDVEQEAIFLPKRDLPFRFELLIVVVRSTVFSFHFATFVTLSVHHASSILNKLHSASSHLTTKRKIVEVSHHRKL